VYVPLADDHPSLNFDENGYIYHHADDSAMCGGDASSSSELSIHSSPFVDPLVHFEDDDVCYCIIPP
jgi:hypothetical protein